MIPRKKAPARVESGKGQINLTVHEKDSPNPATDQADKPLACDTEVSGNVTATESKGIANGSGLGPPVALPRFMRRLLANCPSHGNGVHQWIFKVALRLHTYCDGQTIVEMLTAAVAGCGREVPETEIIDAVENSAPNAGKRTGKRRKMKGKRLRCAPPPKWHTNEAKRREIIEASNFKLIDLIEASPVLCANDETDAEFFADALFPGNPLLCVGSTNSHFNTAPRESFRGMLSEMSLIVPSPMSALTGKRKKDGQESAHTLDNTGPRQYLITEFDSGTADEQAALIWHLKTYAPLVLVLSSGGKSLHGWWDCRGIDESVTYRFMRYAVSIGADKATWTRSQFIRLPQGWRADKQRRQEVFYFDPKGGKEFSH